MEWNDGKGYAHGYLNGKLIGFVAEYPRVGASWVATASIVEDAPDTPNGWKLRQIGEFDTLAAAKTAVETNADPGQDAR
jgi:hypothetical protein